MTRTREVFRITLLLSVLSVASRLIGFVREQAIAWRFGAGEMVDAFVAATFVPQLLLGIIGVGALVTPFLPVYVEHRGTPRGRLISATAFFAVFVTTLLLCIVAWLWAPQIVRVVVGDFSAAQQALTADLVKIMAIATMFSNLGGFITMLFNAHQNFAIPALSVFGLNFVVVPAVLFISGLTIGGLAIATAVGTLVPLLVMMIMARLRGYPFIGRPQLRSSEFAQLLKLAAPLWFSAAFGQIYTLVDRRLASGLDVGSMAALNFGNRLVQLPLSIIVATLSTALFPTVSEHWAKGDSKALARVVNASVRGVLLLMIPASVGLVVLRYPIIRLAFERGEFDANATANTAVALAYYALGLTGLSLGQILSRVFHAMQDTLTPVKIGLASVVLSTLLALALVGPLGHGGLALTTSVGATVVAGVLMFVLSRRLENGAFNVGSLLVKIGVASAAMGYVAAAVLGLTVGFGQIIALGTATVAGMGVYGLLLLALRVEEAHWGVGLVRQKVNAVLGRKVL